MKSSRSAFRSFAPSTTVAGLRLEVGEEVVRLRHQLLEQRHGTSRWLGGAHHTRIGLRRPRSRARLEAVPSGLRGRSSRRGVPRGAPLSTTRRAFTSPPASAPCARPVGWRSGSARDSAGSGHGLNLGGRAALGCGSARRSGSCCSRWACSRSRCSGWVSYTVSRDELQRTVGRMQTQAAEDLALFTERSVETAVEACGSRRRTLPIEEFSPQRARPSARTALPAAPVPLDHRHRRRRARPGRRPRSIARSIGADLPGRIPVTGRSSTRSRAGSRRRPPRPAAQPGAAHTVTEAARRAWRWCCGSGRTAPRPPRSCCETWRRASRSSRRRPRCRTSWTARAR